MEFLDPLAVHDISLASRDVLHVTSVDEHHLEASLFEDVVDRDPVHAGGLHRHGVDAAGLKPVDHAIQVRRERLESADRFRISIDRHGHVVVPGPAVDPCGIGLDPLERLRLLCLGRAGTLASNAVTFHRLLLHARGVVSNRGQGAVVDILLNGITQARHQ